MDDQVKIVVDFKENENISEILFLNLRKFNESIIGKYKARPFLIYLKNRKSQVVGGIRGDIFGKLCRVFTVWINEKYRHQGLGRELFVRLDALANNKKCKIIQLDTTEFQAKGFYEKLGFQVIATLPDNFMGYTTYIMRKYAIDKKK